VRIRPRHPQPQLQLASRDASPGHSDVPLLDCSLIAMWWPREMLMGVEDADCCLLYSSRPHAW
jgi:hypothetical protein